MPFQYISSAGSSSVLFSSIPTPPDVDETLEDLRAEFMPEILAFFGVLAGLTLVFWLVRGLAHAS